MLASLFQLKWASAFLLQGWAAYQAAYASLLARSPNAFAFWVASISAAHGVSLLGFTFAFLAMDRIPALRRRYKLQLKGPPKPLFDKALKGLFVNSFVMYPVIATLLYGVLAETVVDISPETAPSASTAARQLLVCILVEDCLFYWVHRALHHRRLYWIHKTHHEFKQNLAPAAEYFHTLEDLMNITPFLTGPLVQRVHLSVFLAWVFVRVSEFVDAHSGYGVPWSVWSYCRPSERHEF